MGQYINGKISKKMTSEWCYKHLNNTSSCLYNSFINISFLKIQDDEYVSYISSKTYLGNIHNLYSSQLTGLCMTTLYKYTSQSYNRVQQ